MSGLAPARLSSRAASRRHPTTSAHATSHCSRPSAGRRQRLSWQRDLPYVPSSLYSGVTRNKDKCSRSCNTARSARQALWISSAAGDRLLSGHQQGTLGSSLSTAWSRDGRLICAPLRRLSTKDPPDIVAPF